MTYKERRWRRHLAAVIRFAEDIENAIPGLTRKQPLRLCLFQLLVSSRRNANAVYRLGPDFAFEASILVRTLTEVWVNIQWILVAAPKQRANRFLRHEMVEAVRAIERVPPRFLSGRRIQGLLRDRKRYRDQFCRHLFAKRDKKGRLRWDESWASTSSVKDRATELVKKGVIKPSDVQGMSTVYSLFGDLSERAHGSAFGIAPLFEVSRGQLRVKYRPTAIPATPTIDASAVLLDISGTAANEFGVYVGRHGRLLERQKRLIDTVGV